MELFFEMSESFPFFMLPCFSVESYVVDAVGKVKLRTWMEMVCEHENLFTSCRKIGFGRK